MVAEYSFIQIFFCTDSFLNCTVCSSYITELCRSHSNIGTFCMIKACIFLGWKRPRGTSCLVLQCIPWTSSPPLEPEIPYKLRSSLRNPPPLPTHRPSLISLSFKYCPLQQPPCYEKPRTLLHWGQADNVVSCYPNRICVARCRCLEWRELSTFRLVIFRLSFGLQSHRRGLY